MSTIIEVRIKPELDNRLTKAKVIKGTRPALIRRLLENWLAEREKLTGKNKDIVGYIREFRKFLDNLEARLN